MGALIFDIDYFSLVGLIRNTNVACYNLYLYFDGLYGLYRGLYLSDIGIPFVLFRDYVYQLSGYSRGIIPLVDQEIRRVVTDQEN